MTHNELVKKSAAWLRDEMRCPIVVTGFTPYAGESPDVMGFFDGGDSIMIECKTSRADFNTDRNKVFRRIPKNGMGDYRYLAIANDILRDYDEIYDKWGVIIFSDDSFEVTSQAKKIKSLRKDVEVSYMVGAIRNSAIPICCTNSKIKINNRGLSFMGKYRKYAGYEYFSDEEIQSQKELMIQWDTDRKIQEENERKFKRDQEMEIQYRKDREDFKREFIATYNATYPNPDGTLRGVFAMFD
jgi:hypothetical protein